MRSTVVRNRNEVDNRRSRRSKSDAAVDLIRTQLNRLVRNITILCDGLQARVDRLIRDVD